MSILEDLRADAQQLPTEALTSEIGQARVELESIDPEGFATLTLRDEMAAILGRILFEAMTVSHAAGDPLAGMFGDPYDESAYTFLSQSTIDKVKESHGRFAVGYLLADVALEMTRELGEFPTL